MSLSAAGSTLILSESGGWSNSSRRASCGSCLLVAQPLCHEKFIGLDRLQEVRQFPRRYRDTLRMALPAAVEFLTGDHQLFFRVAMEDRVVFRMTLHPMPIDECVGGAGIERVIADWNLPILHGRILKSAGPIIDMVDLEAASWLNLRAAFWRCRHRGHQELLVVGNHALHTESARLKSHAEGFSGTLTQCGMVDRVIDLEQVIRKPLMQCPKRPCGMLPRVHSFRHLSNIPRDLGIPLQVVDKLRIRCAECALH